MAPMAGHVNHSLYLSSLSFPRQARSDLVSLLLPASNLRDNLFIQRVSSISMPNGNAQTCGTRPTCGKVAYHSCQKQACFLTKKPKAQKLHISIFLQRITTH